MNLRQLTSSLRVFTSPLCRGGRIVILQGSSQFHATSSSLSCQQLSTCFSLVFFVKCFFNPNFAIELPACSADRQNSHAASRWDSAFGGVTCGIVPPMATATAGQAGLTPLTPKRCVAARRADFSNEKSGLKYSVNQSADIKRRNYSRAMRSCPMYLRSVSGTSTRLSSLW